MQGIAEFLALTKMGVGVSLDGRRITAPPGLVDAEGYTDLDLSGSKSK